MSDPLPPRFQQETRIRKVEKQANAKGGGPTGISESAYTVEDENEVVRCYLGKLASGEYGLELYDSAGALKFQFRTS